MYGFEQARDRDGSAAEDRDESVDELMNWDRLGRGNGDPLAADSYDKYPDRPEELSAPGQENLLRSLLGHPLVTDVDDAVEELAGPRRDRVVKSNWTDALRDAVSAATIDSDELWDASLSEEARGPDDALRRLTDGWPADAVGPENPLLVGHLYAERGLSVDEIGSVLDSPRGQVRGTLEQCGLIEATEDTQRDPKTETDLRLGGTTMRTEETEQSGGLTVHTNDF